MDKAHESLLAFFSSLVNSGIFQHTAENLSNRSLNYSFHHLSGNIWILLFELIGLLLMIGSNLTVFSQQKQFHLLELFLEPRRQNSQPHNLNQADIFFLNMLNISMRVVNAVRMFWGSLIVPQDQV